MVINMIDRVGDFKQHTLHCSVREIEAVLGPANCHDDPSKVKYSWGFEVDGVRCGIWDYYESYKQGVFSAYGPREVLERVFPGFVIV